MLYVYVLTGLVVLLILVFALDAWCNSRVHKTEDVEIENARMWVGFLQEASNKIVELGFDNSLRYGSVLLDNDVVSFFPVDGVTDVVEDNLANFDRHKFGEEIVLYVQKSRNLAFLMVRRGQRVSRAVYELKSFPEQSSRGDI